MVTIIIINGQSSKTPMVDSGVVLLLPKLKKYHAIFAEPATRMSSASARQVRAKACRLDESGGMPISSSVLSRSA
jgi:hypothetical protein